MRVEGWLFLGCGVFFIGADVVYWYTSQDPTGTTALARAIERYDPDESWRVPAD